MRPVARQNDDDDAPTPVSDDRRRCSSSALVPGFQLLKVSFREKAPRFLGVRLTINV
jgi:hypothetical protein